MLELIFRGVDIRGLVESYFGPQLMFFLVSSVSLFENELGIKNLSRASLVSLRGCRAFPLVASHAWKAGFLLEQGSGQKENAGGVPCGFDRLRVSGGTRWLCEITRI